MDFDEALRQRIDVETEAAILGMKVIKRDFMAPDEFVLMGDHSIAIWKAGTVYIMPVKSRAKIIQEFLNPVE